MGLGHGCVDPAKDDPSVLGGGEGREDGDGLEESAAQQQMVHGRPDLIHQDEGEAEDLHQGIELAEQAGAEVAERAGGEEQGGDEQDSQVATEDEDGDITWDQAHVGEGEEERAEQEFVGDGVEILAEDSALRERPCEQAVEAVAEAGDDEESKCDVISPVHDCYDEKRDKEQPHERKQIGSGAKLCEKGHLDWGRPIVRHLERECRSAVRLRRGWDAFRLKERIRGA